MSTNNSSVTIERIDHGVLPANELGRAFRFWSSFMGAKLKETYWGPDPRQIPWHEPDTDTAHGYDPFGNRIQIGVLAKRPLTYGNVGRAAKSA